MADSPSSGDVLVLGPDAPTIVAALAGQPTLVVRALENGVLGLEALADGDPDVVVLTPHLGDLTASEFLMAARRGGGFTRYLLIDDPKNTKHILQAVQVGIDGFLTTPPDKERVCFEVVRQYTLAQRLRESLRREARIAELEAELARQSAALQAKDAEIVDLQRELAELNEAFEQALKRAVDAVAERETARPAPVDLGPRPSPATQSRRSSER